MSAANDLPFDDNGVGVDFRSARRNLCMHQKRFPRTQQQREK